MPSLSWTVIDKELMCYFKDCLSADTVNSIYILVIKPGWFIRVLRRHFPCILKQAASETLTYCHCFNIVCVLSYFVIYNFVFLEILILMPTVRTGSTKHLPPGAVSPSPPGLRGSLLCQCWGGCTSEHLSREGRRQTQVTWSCYGECCPRIAPFRKKCSGKGFTTPAAFTAGSRLASTERLIGWQTSGWMLLRRKRGQRENYQLYWLKKLNEAQVCTPQCQIHMSTWVYTCTRVYTHASAHTCTCTPAHRCTRTHVNTHAHMYTHA